MAAPNEIFGIKLSTRGYDALFDALLNAVPPGSFYDINIRENRPMVVWTNKPTLLTFETDNPGIPVKITTRRKGDYHPNIDQGNFFPEAFIVPQNPQTPFKLTLGQGLNRVEYKELITGGRQGTFEVFASSNVLIMEPMARELFKPINIYNLQYAAIYSKYATRLLDQVIRFQDLLPDVQSLKILSTKLLTRSAVHFPAKEIGVRNAVESFTLNTPAMVRARSTSEFFHERDVIQTLVQNKAGKEAHVWFPNLAVTRWLAFTRMADTLRDNYELLDVRDDLVRILYKNVEQIHNFEFDAPGANFLTNLSLTNCFDNIEMAGNFAFSLHHRICLWTYTFDLIVSDITPIGNQRVSFDLDIPLDSNLSFDADAVDPFTDGWVGWPLTGRFELDAPSTNDAEFALDTMVQPAGSFPGPAPACVYDRGPYTQMLNNIRTDIEIENIVTADGEMDTYTPGPIVGLDLQLPSSPLTVGVPVTAYGKYVDSMGMTNPTGAGTINAQESNGGALTPIVVTAGFQSISLTPTKAGPAIFWSLSDGFYLGVSETRLVNPGPLDNFDIPTLVNQSIGAAFLVSIQCLDLYGNPTNDFGINNKVIVSGIGLSGVSVDSESSFTAGEDMPANTAVYVSGSNGVDIGRDVGRIYSLNPNIPARSDFVGFTTAPVLQGNTIAVQIGGVKTGFSGLTFGDTLYADLVNFGGYTTTLPLSNVVILGSAISATEVDISTPAPAAIELDSSGFGTGNIRVNAAGVGQLRFTLGAIQTDSNVITVS